MNTSHLPFSLLAALIICHASAHAAERPPNIVFILADDLGWSDTTLYGTTKFYETPNMQRLAERGMNFHNAYAAAPICSPTRASIMTGLYPGRIGFTAPNGADQEERLEARLIERSTPTQKSQQAKSVSRLKLEYVTLGEAFQQAGYVTGHFGKWHLGPEPFDPLHQGFSVDIPHWSGPGPSSYLAPWKAPRFKLPAQPGDHVEDLMAEQAVRFIREHQHEPFYLNYWAFSVHSPWQAKPGLIEKYRRKADPNSDQRNPVYGAMVQSLDEAVGRLLDTLDELKLTDKTIIVFFSDNGGVDWFEPAMKTEAGMDSPPTSNTPLRAGKATLYEGGTREPCAIVWPGHVKPGSQSDAFISTIDLYPTLLAMTGVPVPIGVQFDGVNQVPALLGAGTPRTTAFCYYPHYSVTKHGGTTVPGIWVRQGDWKLIRLFNDAEDQSDRFELYNLRDDLGETKNLAAPIPDKVQELNALISQHLAETHTLVPGKNPAYSPRVSDWTTGKDGALTLRDGALLITAKTGGPTMATRDLVTGKGPFTVEFRMKSNCKGNGRVFWAANPKENYSPERTATFKHEPDNEWHDYAVKLPIQWPIQMLRLDLGGSVGEVRIQSLRLKDSTGALVKEWPLDKH